MMQVKISEKYKKDIRVLAALVPIISFFYVTWSQENEKALIIY